MIKVEDILNLNLTKISSAPLRKAIEDWITDYGKESDKELFANESKENINKLYSMVEQYAPEAIKRAEKKPEPKEEKPGEKSKAESEKGNGKLMKILILVIGDFKGVLEKLKQSDLDEADMVVLLEMTEQLEKALESGDDKKIKKAVEAQLDAFDKWQEGMKKSKNKTHKEEGKKATESINKLLEELGIPKLESNGAAKPKSKPKEEKAEESQTTILTKELVREVIDGLTDIEIDLDGHDETIIASTRMLLDEALDEAEQSKFRKKIEKEAESFKDWAMDISNAKARKQSITSMNKLFNALGETLLDADGKEKNESDKARSKRILDELEDLQPELERCRAVVSEANKKKRDAKGSKPKKTRLTQLKNKLLSIAGLIPPQLKENPDVQKKTEKILLTAHRELVNAWGMNKVKAKPGAEAIKEKFDAIEDKLSNEIESYNIYARSGGGYSVTEVFKDGHKNTTRLSKATIDWVNEDHGGSFDIVGAKKLLQKDAEYKKEAPKKKTHSKPKPPLSDYLQKIVDEIKKEGIKVKKVEEETQITDALIDLDGKFHVQVIDHSPRNPTFVLTKELAEDTFLSYDEVLSVNELIKQIVQADQPTEKEIIKHLSRLSNSKLANDAAYILSGDLDRIEARIESSKESRIKTEQELAKAIIGSENMKTYLKEIGFKN